MSDDIPMTREQKFLALVILEEARKIPSPGEGTYLDHETAATKVADLARRAVCGHWEDAGIPVPLPQSRPGLSWADVDYLTDEAIFDQRDLREAQHWLEDALGAPLDAPIAASVGADMLDLGYRAHLYATRVLWTHLLRSQPRARSP